MKHSAELLRCLVAVDVEGMRRLHAHAFPHLPMMPDDRAVLVAIHYARTQSGRVSVRLRAYSHAWLLDNRLPSGLPDYLKPRAERWYPRNVDAVGISVNSMSSFFRPFTKIVERAMCDAVEECYADGKKEPTFVKARMMEAKAKAIKSL